MEHMARYYSEDSLPEPGVLSPSWTCGGAAAVAVVGEVLLLIRDCYPLVI